MAEIVEHYAGGARHALLFAVPMILIGEYISERRINTRIKTKKAVAFFFISWLLALGEVIVLKNFLSGSISLDVSLFGWLPAVFLMIIGLEIKATIAFSFSRSIRKVADVIYVIHIWVLLLVNRFTSLNLLNRFAVVLVFSFCFAFCFEFFVVIYRKRGKRSNLN